MKNQLMLLFFIVCIVSCSGNNDPVEEVVDGVDFLVAQSFLARKGFSSGDVAADELGQLWRFTSDVTPGFSFSGNCCVKGFKTTYPWG